MFSSQGSLRQELDELRREVRSLTERMLPLEASSTAVTSELEDLADRGELHCIVFTTKVLNV